MKFELTLWRTLFGWVFSVLIIGSSILVLNLWPSYEDNRVFFLSSVIFFSPILIWTSIILFKMWKRKTTKILW